MRVKLRLYTGQLPEDMQKAVRHYEMSTADQNGRLVVSRVILEGTIEPHEPVQTRWQDDPTGFAPLP